MQGNATMDFGCQKGTLDNPHIQISIHSLLIFNS